MCTLSSPAVRDLVHALPWCHHILACVPQSYYATIAQCLCDGLFCCTPALCVRYYVRQCAKPKARAALALAVKVNLAGTVVQLSILWPRRRAGEGAGRGKGGGGWGGVPVGGGRVCVVASLNAFLWVPAAGKQVLASGGWHTGSGTSMC